MKPHLFLGLFLLVISSCQNNSNNSTSGTAVTKGKYTLYPAPPSKDYPDASLEYYHYADGVFSFIVKGSDYQLGQQTPDAPQMMCANSGQGQHIHLIIDNEPYHAAYTANFEYQIPDGKHYMMAFLSRSYHESIKTETAFAAHKVQVRNNRVFATSTIKEPMLFYSRPKGIYIGEDTKKIMVDFYLWEADLGGAYKVLLEINGEEQYIIDKWQPYYLEGLPMGENKIKLTLVYNNGETVNTKFNPIERTITLKQ